MKLTQKVYNLVSVIHKNNYIDKDVKIEQLYNPQSVEDSTLMFFNSILDKSFKEFC